MLSAEGIFWEFSDSTNSSFHDIRTSIHKKGYFLLCFLNDHSKFPFSCNFYHRDQISLCILYCPGLIATSHFI